jgi:hypothetical protein
MVGSIRDYENEKALASMFELPKDRMWQQSFIEFPEDSNGKKPDSIHLRMTGSHTFKAPEFELDMKGVAW